MSRRPLILCGAVFAASFFAWSAAPAFAQPLLCNFAAKVHFLAPGIPYDPSSRIPPPQGAPVGQPYANDLNQAFAIAPVAFQAQLCGLDGVFIDQTACSSVQDCMGHAWGFRQRNPTVGQGRYIGIPGALWTARPTYSQFADLLFHALIPLNSAGYSAANSAANTFATTVLAALAHEVGHVRWYDIIDPGRNGGHNFNAFCGGNFFSSWLGVHAPPEWRVLLNLNERRNHPPPDHHRNGGHVTQVDAELATPLVAGDLLDQLYAPSAPWASFFGAISPDEDFVETYKFKVLISASPPLTSLPMTIQGTGGIYRENVPVAYLSNQKPDLATKVGCIPL